MDNRRKTGDNYYQELPRNKSHNYHGKPPLGGNSNWQQGYPSWEKEFVTVISSMSWKNFLYAKGYIHLFDNIMKWDDSAGEEAFQTAKDNFHAKVHGLQRDIKPHNPNLYIDKIDWNAKTDGDLILDLDSDSIAPDSDSDNNREPVVIFGDALPDPYRNYSSYGWGDENNTSDCQNKIPEGCNNGINYDDYVNNWDVDFGAINTPWYLNENDNKAHVDQSWNNDNKAHVDQDYANKAYVAQDWNNANKAYVAQDWNSDNKTHVDQGWNKDNNWGWKTNKYYGNVNNGGGKCNSWRFNNGNNDRSWRNNGHGNRRKPVGQAHGSQWVHRVHP